MTELVGQHSQPSVLAESKVAELRADFAGELFFPGDPGYEAARLIWNAMIDKHPAVIARCTGVSDVVAATNFARRNNLVLAVKCGGHNVAGFATCEGGIVIDLSPMRAVRVDPESRHVWAQGGCLLKDVDQATQAYGLATPAGTVSHTGLSGLALGGGIGWLGRTYGLTCDNLLAAEVVTADGRVVHASTTENPDLLWGLQGGGGNFGIVTEFEFQAYPVSNVLFGSVIYPLSEARAVLQQYRQFIATEPDEMHAVCGFRLAPPLPSLPAHLRNIPTVSLGILYLGDHEEGRRLMQPLLEFGSPLVSNCEPLPYTVLQQMLDAGSPHGLHYYSKSGYLADLSEGAIEALIQADAAITSPFTQIDLGYLGGAIARVDENATAFSNRQAPYVVNIVAGWSDSADSPANREWARQTWSSLQPYATGGAYVNFLSVEQPERVRAAYGSAKYERLVALKKKYDPTNLFRLNQNINPADA